MTSHEKTVDQITNATPSVKNGLSMSLKTDKKEYHLNENIQAFVRLQNVSSAVLVVDNREGIYSFYFVDSKGEMYRFPGFKDGGRDWGPLGFTMLNVGDAIETRETINIQTYINKPGPYFLIVHTNMMGQPDPKDYTHPESVPPAWNGSISSNISITINP